MRTGYHVNAASASKLSALKRGSIVKGRLAALIYAVVQIAVVGTKCSRRDVNCNPCLRRARLRRAAVTVNTMRVLPTA